MLQYFWATTQSSMISALVSSMPVKRELNLKPCPCLQANQAYEHPTSHRLWKQVGEMLELRERMIPQVMSIRRFLQHFCSTVILGPFIPLIMRSKGLSWWLKAANLFSALIVSCASSQRFFPSSQKTCIIDLAGVRSRPWMRLGASSLLSPGRWLRSNSRWSLFFSPRHFSHFLLRYFGRLSHSSVAHLAWNKGVCQERAAFDITFQHKTTISLNTLKASVRYIHT